MLILWIVAATKGRKRKRHQDRSSSFPVWGSPWAAGLLAVIRSVLFTLGCSCYAERLVFTFSLRNIEYRFWKQALKAKQKTHTHTLTLTKSKTNSTTQVASWFIISMFWFFFFCFLCKHLTDDIDILGADHLFRATHHANLENLSSLQMANSWITHDLILKEKDKPPGPHASLCALEKPFPHNTWHRDSGLELFNVTATVLSLTD